MGRLVSAHNKHSEINVQTGDKVFVVFTAWQPIHDGMKDEEREGK